jgi:hypothetical protein
MAFVALSLSACGGSGASAPPASATPAAAPAASAPAPGPPGAAAPQPVVGTNKLSPRESGSGSAFPVSKQAPPVIVDHITRHQPMLVYFYDPQQLTSDDQRREIDAAMKEYRGLIDLVAFDVTGALPDAVTNKVPEGKEGEQVALLTQDLKIGFTPTIILVDKKGQITGRYRGFIDRGLLGREILKATQ